jgi:hypothetical protein
MDRLASLCRLDPVRHADTAQNTGDYEGLEVAPAAPVVIFVRASPASSGVGGSVRVLE